MATVESYPVFDELAKLLSSLPPRKVLAFKPSEKSQARVNYLLAKNKTGGLTTAETAEMERFMILEHIIRMAKTQAAIKLGNNGRQHTESHS